jgi:hypothetical protein
MNWLEKQVQGRIAWVIPVGYRGGRRVFAVVFEDGTERDYYIDFDAKMVEEVL